MATFLDDLRASLNLDQLGLGQPGLGGISFTRTADQLSSFGSDLGNQLADLWGGPSGAAGITVDSLRGVLPAATGPTPVIAGARYSTLYIFGDSLSDAGNVSAATGSLAPASPYVDGTFSNGPIWVDYLSQYLSLPPPKPSLQGGTDFAYGGAETGGTAVHTTTPIDLPGQLLQFEAQVANPQPGALYAVWAGGNDLIDAVRASGTNPLAAQTAVDQAVANVGTFVNSLADRGARNLVVLNAPDLGQTPYETGGGAQQAATATALSARFNTELQAAMAQIAQTRQLQIDLVDVGGLLDKAVANPGAYGFTDARTPVWSGGFTPGSSGTLAASGAAQSNYVFFDKLHPTTAADAVIGVTAAASVLA
jgi:phospholipase/lecithinase/hemolysin